MRDVAPLEGLTARVDAGEPLTDDDVLVLGATRDIITLGKLAMVIRRKLHGSLVTYLRVADLKLDQLADVGPRDAGEVRVFETPLSLEAAVDAVTAARESAGTTPLSAFCLYELSKLPEGLPVVLAALKKAGLEAIAQAPLDRLAEPEQALEAMADAGLILARLTVNQTPDRPWTDVCRTVASLQTRLESIRAFAPLPRKISVLQPTTGYDDVRRIALARLLVGGVDCIQVDWALYGPKLAQVGLTFGADDVDSVSPDDDSSQGWRRSALEEILRGIRAAGFVPVERDGRFERRD